MLPKGKSAGCDTNAGGLQASISMYITYHRCALEQVLQGCWSAAAPCSQPVMCVLCVRLGTVRAKNEEYRCKGTNKASIVLYCVAMAQFSVTFHPYFWICLCGAEFEM